MKISQNIKSYAEKWKDIKWPRVRRYVLRLQKSIYAASLENNANLVRQKQRILLDSWQAKLLATRKVTQDNAGKKTAGVDGVKSIKPAERWDFAKSLIIGTKAKPARRVWISKHGTDEKRPLGIPTLRDRGLQALVKIVIEPEWEAKFEANSYGFRPGRSCHDATKQIIYSIQSKPKFVLETDISKCFDRINHKALLQKLGYKGRIHYQIKEWLKAGVLNENVFEETTAGTPQGGVISPLLANIALHGIENNLKTLAEEIPMRYTIGKAMSKRDKRSSLAVIRYADDLVVMHENEEVVLQSQVALQEWLKPMGLELKKEKTRITHTLENKKSEEHQAGFDFLGMTIKQFPSRYHSATRHKEDTPDLRTLMYPSKKSIAKHQERLKDIIRKSKGQSQDELIKELNPIITGWTNYFAVSDGSTTGTFNKMDNLLYLRLRKWGQRRSSTAAKAYRKYWSNKQGRVDFVGEKATLVKYRDVASGKSTTKYIKVIGKASPYDGNYPYWASRLGESLDVNPSQAKLLKRQKGKCARCKMYFLPEDVIETDHINPEKTERRNKYENLQLLHKHCHDNKTAEDREKYHDKEKTSE